MRYDYRGGHGSNAESAKVYLSARSIVSLLVTVFPLATVLSYVAGSLLSQSHQSWVAVAVSSQEAEGECLRTDDMTSMFLQFQLSVVGPGNVLRESCIGYGTTSTTSRRRRRRDSDYESMMSTSTSTSEETNAAFYESLVHPPMFCHENPVRVAVLVDSVTNTEEEVEVEAEVEAVVSELLKHTTVQQVEVFVFGDATTCKRMSQSLRRTTDLDPRVIHIICSNQKPADGDDAIVLRDVILRRAAEEIKILYDVILWNNRRSLPSQMMTKILEEVSSSNGILVVAPPPAPETIPRKVWNRNRHQLVQDLGQAGFQTIFDYDRLHQPGNNSSSNSKNRFAFIQSTIPQSFLIAMKDRYHRTNWYLNQAQVQLAVQTRTAAVAVGGGVPVLTSHDGEESPSLFRYFDGATQMALKFPSRLLENAWWCQQERVGVLFPYNNPENHCDSSKHGFDPDIPNVPASALEVKISGLGEKAGRGVFASSSSSSSSSSRQGMMIPRGSMVCSEECVQGMYIPPSTYSLLLEIDDRAHNDQEADHSTSFDRWRGPLGYIYGYSWQENEYGKPSLGVDPGIMTFSNHGCNGTYNIGRPMNVTEQNAITGLGPAANGVDEEIVPIYNPVVDRHFPHWGCGNTNRALRDIEAGEELLDNYLPFGGTENGTDWEEHLAELKRLCSGDGVGIVAEYEASSSLKDD